MLPTFLSNRKTYLLIALIVTILGLLTLSYAFFQRQSLLGDISNNTVVINTIEEGSITKSIITTYDNSTMEIETGILFLDNEPFSKIVKFKVENLYSESQNISINWNLITSSLNNYYSSYYLYECSENDYHIANESNASSLCTLLSSPTDNLLPNTGEKSKLHLDEELTIAGNAFKYFIAIINIGAENNQNSFEATIKVKDCLSHTLTMQLNGGNIGQVSSIDIPNGTNVLLPYPTKENDAFYKWNITSGIGASIVGNDFYIGETDVNIEAIWLSDIVSYTGTKTIIADSNGNWRVKFLTSGILSLNESMAIDVFLVGGGAGTPGRSSSSTYYSGGGGGGYTTTGNNIAIEANVEQEIVVGAGGPSNGYSGGIAGSASLAFSYSAAGGSPSGQTTASGQANGGAGGSGGGGNHSSGGVDGSDGNGSVKGSGGLGQNSTTREFGEAQGDLYAGGGASNGGAVSLGGGAASCQPGVENTGGGGGGCSGSRYYGTAGGSGVVIIRNHVENRNEIVLNDTVLAQFNGFYELIDEGYGNWNIKLLSDGVFIPRNIDNIDIFLVGGGGSSPGRSSSSKYYSGGGGGGYTATHLNLEVNYGQEYLIDIGAGAKMPLIGGASSGNPSSAFGYSVNGGNGAGQSTSTNSGGGGAGGSGGGTSGSAGGTDGGNGGGTGGGIGQGITTRAFGLIDGELFASGGAGSSACVNGGNNTGDGGGGCSGSEYDGKAGGSGIIIIRNHR